ncbi:MetQ/NlpA family ABC transporter substrate-binding protein [Catellatospora sichuanensis]|uniref:MetQ/NlpA family ABC transporter substrate-binding protein n=1 Tax=Catellatospora sichuanensis TaxID=1969805 RepID=UPI0011845887|nr:MetQ/NlpA family ABC transporter substrate-binding protein [Catellatospora sichuanensis]
MNRRALVAIPLALLAGLALAACGTPAADKPTDVLLIGASSAPHAQILAEAANLVPDLKLQIKEFDDYVQPNLATESGELDANYFQHQAYLDDFAAANPVHLVAVAPVHIEPLGAYSKKVKSLAELAPGADVAIPADATNGGRALALLAGQGLITLKDGAGVKATERDIATNPKQLKITALEAAQLPRSLEDVDLAVINGNFALQAGLKPATDALALEAAKDNPYANLLVVKRGRETDQRIQRLAQVLASPEIKKFIESTYDGAVIPAS